MIKRQQAVVEQRPEASDGIDKAIILKISAKKREQLGGIREGTTEFQSYCKNAEETRRRAELL